MENDIITTLQEPLTTRKLAKSKRRVKKKRKENNNEKSARLECCTVLPLLRSFDPQMNLKRRHTHNRQTDTCYREISFYCFRSLIIIEWP